MRIIEQPLLARRTTIGLGGPARSELIVQTDSDFERLARVLEQPGANPYVLGRGSNVLAREGQLPYDLIRDGREGQPSIGPGSGPEQALVQAQAGLPLVRVLAWAQSKGLSGLEGLIGIPGTLGGAIAMNAGAYGQDISDCLRAVQVWTPSQGLFWIQASQCLTGYRRLVIPGLGTEFWMLTAVRLGLSVSDRQAVRRTMAANYSRKRNTQPVTAWTCGCVFCNPGPKSAGRLLDACGLRGQVLSGMAWSELHANFLINLGTGTSQAALELIYMARKRVKAWFDLDLRLEVREL
jgi:UDP-N-acetylmuramate dehydrogenase